VVVRDDMRNDFLAGSDDGTSVNPRKIMQKQRVEMELLKLVCSPNGE
jgi:hypothetical protein